MSIIEAIDKSPLAAALNGILEFPGQVLQAAGDAVGAVPAALEVIDVVLSRAADSTTPSPPVSSAVSADTNPFAVALQGFNFAGLSCVKPDNIQEVSGQNLCELAPGTTQGTPQLSPEQFFGRA